MPLAKEETDFSRGNDKNYTKSIAYQANNGTDKNNSSKDKDKDKDANAEFRLCFFKQEEVEEEE